MINADLSSLTHLAEIHAFEVYLMLMHS